MTSIQANVPLDQSEAKKKKPKKNKKKNKKKEEEDEEQLVTNEDEAADFSPRFEQQLADFTQTLTAIFEPTQVPVRRLVPNLSKEWQRKLKSKVSDEQCKSGSLPPKIKK